MSEPKASESMSNVFGAGPQAGRHSIRTPSGREAAL